ACEHAPQLPQRLLLTRLVALRLDAVDRVVESDVLEGRDAEAKLERAVLERQPAHVRDDRLETGNLGLREVDADALARAERDAAGEIRGPGQRATDTAARPPAPSRPRRGAGPPPRPSCAGRCR